MYSNKENVNILTALLVEYGIRHVVVCPGSRNSALVHNFNECPDIECYPVTDERSAAFVALGISLQTGDLTAVCVTSGSALLNTLPGVAEASYQQKGIIVISADRPQQWIGQLDGQTMPQPDALGSFVAKSVSLPECQDDEQRWHCRRLVCEAILERVRSGKSVLINVPVSEPLFCYDVEKLPVVVPVLPLSWDGEMGRNEVLELLADAERPMIVLGQMARYMIDDELLNDLRQNIVVLAEPLSTDSPSPSLDDAFVLMGEERDAYKPDLVIYLGGTTVSKRLRMFLRSVDDDCVVIMQNKELLLEDPTMHARYILVGNAMQILGDLSVTLAEDIAPEFHTLWDELLEATEARADEKAVTITQKAVQLFEELMTVEDDVYYANSSAVRLAARYAKHYVYCNRGLNGIEGSMSAAVGASLVSEKNVYLVIGDLSFFYDQNALWNQSIKGNLRILLLNNGGGEIFNTLPGLNESPAIDFIAGKHPTTAVGACHQYGISRKAASKIEDLQKAMEWLTEDDSNCPRLVEVINL